MNVRIPLFMLALMPCMFHAGHAEAQTVRQLSGRIAFSTDGNLAGSSDIAGTPLAVALLNKTGQSHKIVYVDYANHYWNNISTTAYNDYKTALNTTFTKFNLDTDLLFDISRDRSAARTALVTEINRSTASNPLRIFLNGPAAHLCDAVTRSNTTARPYVTVYTHGSTDSATSVSGSCNMAELLQIKPTTVNNVAYPAFGSLQAGYSNFTWLRDNTDNKVNWIYNQLTKISTSQGNIRDAGSVLALLTNDRTLTPADFAAQLGGASTPVEPDPVTPPQSGALADVLNDSCYSKIWNPATSHFGVNNWGYQRSSGSTHAESTGLDRRASYVSNGPGGVDAVRFVSYGNYWNSLLDYKKGNATPYMPAAGMETARFVVKYYIDNNYEPYTAGRLAAGLIIGDPNGRITCMSGGCVPENQQGSSVRVNFSRSLKAKLYSYNLNRNTPRIFWESKLEGVSSGYRQFGFSPSTTVAMPKGQWVTLVLDVDLNDVGHANGSSRLRVYNAAGNLLTSVSINNAIYRNNSRWKIVGPYMTEKYDGSQPGPKTQYMYARGFSIYNKRASCQ